MRDLDAGVDAGNAAINTGVIRLKGGVEWRQYIDDGGANVNVHLKYQEVDQGDQGEDRCETEFF